MPNLESIIITNCIGIAVVILTLVSSGKHRGRFSVLGILSGKHRGRFSVLGILSYNSKADAGKSAYLSN